MNLGEYRLPLILAATAVMAYLAVPQSIILARKLGAIDRPNERKVHQKKMPRLGGLAIFVAFFLGVVACGPYLVNPYGDGAAPGQQMVYAPFWGMMAGAVIVFVVGMMDDIYQIKPWFKLLGQCLAAGVAMKYGVGMDVINNPFDGTYQLNAYIGIPLTFLWIVGITNAINLLDGLDGLAAGVSGIAAVTLAVVAMLQGYTGIFAVGMVLACAIAGFLPFNFYPARTFMGDGGSNFLGFVLACISIIGLLKSTTVLSLLVPIIILGVPISDTLFAIVRRVYNRVPILSADKNHLHHRLMSMGFSHPGTVLLIYAGAAVFGAIAVLTSIFGMGGNLLIIALLLLAVVFIAEKIGLRTGD